MPRDLSQFETIGAGVEWEDAGIEHPRGGERVHLDYVDGNHTEGRVVSWDEQQLNLLDTGHRKLHPRWTSITRVVFLDRPRGA